jgi:hypothetical protein
MTAVVAVLAAGCASSATRTGTLSTDHNLVTSTELARVGDVSLYEALRQIRPTFLRPRNAVGVRPSGTSAVNTETQVQVYIGTMRMEGVDHLKDIMARNVKEVRLLEPQQANSRYGGNNSGGALVITLM